MISVAGVDFEKRPGVNYKYDYDLLMQRAKAGIADPLKPTEKTDPKILEASVLRALILDDLWFVVYFVLGGGRKTANHPFIVNACRMIEQGPKDFTLDVWSRGHFKTAIVSKAETLQHVLKNPEHANAILSFNKAAAKKILFELKETLQNSELLRLCFPDVIWQNCERDAPLWSWDEGLVLKRRSNMSEPTIGAWGLIEGMPTGSHFHRRVYDDITTQDVAKSIDMMEAIKVTFDSSQNLGLDGGHQRVVGTFYDHRDPLVYVRDKKNLDGTPKYKIRVIPATDDGTANGKPVFISQEMLDNHKGDRTFNCQQLCNPTPQSDQELKFEYMNKISRAFVPKGLFRMMLIDQAGDLASNVKQEGGDAWAIGIVGVEPKKDDIGQSRVFLEDLWVSPASASEAIDQAVRMFTRGGIVHKLGVEKVGTSTTHLHIADALKARGRHVEFSDSPWTVGKFLRPAGRNKKKFIEDSLGWPLNNGKLFYVDDIQSAFLDRLKTEMINFPFYHDDVLNMLAYTYDVIKDCNLEFYDVENKPRSVSEVMDQMPEASYRY